MPSNIGKVYLVGAGPGDPALITLRGKQLLQRADIVFYDYLVNSHLLRYTSPKTQCICLGRHGFGRVLSQEEINQRVVAAARSGNQVVRLKGGDPAIFGRLTEELLALSEANLPWEVVPGVTAASTASSHAGIPLTDREKASCVAFITGQEYREKTASSVDLENLARFPGTLVFYMGVTTAPIWAAQLIEHGKSPDTPVAIVRHCSLPNQQTIRTRLEDVPHVLAPGKLRPPALVIVGEVVATSVNMDWFASRPLFGRRVLVTRPHHQAGEMVDDFIELGAEVLVQPAIEIKPPETWTKVDAAIDSLPSYDWLVFSSSNGVEYLLNRLIERGHDLRQLARCRLAAIGPATAAALEKFYLTTDLQPEEYRAEALADVLAPEVQGQRVLLLRASRGREVLAERLSAQGAQVEQVVVYQSTDVPTPSEDVTAAVRAGQIDWITVTSSAIARSLIAMFGHDLYKSQLAAISPVTAEVLKDEGYTPTVVASPFTTAGIIDAILAHEQAD